jgi:Uma2 family endonuclease
MKVRVAEGVLYPDVVLSPSTRGCDKRDKFILYRGLASLREYVLIDPGTRQVEVFTATADGAWILTDQTGLADIALASLGARLDSSAVFRGVEPPAG